MRTFLLLGVAVLLLGCRDGEAKKAPSRRGVDEATSEQLQALEAGNARLAAKLMAHADEKKKLPENLDALKVWAAGKWDTDDEKALVDPWGNRIVFRDVAPIGIAFTLRSMGPDGQSNSDDLIYDSRDKRTVTHGDRNK